MNFLGKIARYATATLLALAAFLGSMGTVMADELEHYKLKLDVIRVSLDASPTTRIQCAVHSDRGSDQVVFDPADPYGWTRYALLPAGSTDRSISCTSDRILLQDAAFFYHFTRTLPDKITGTWTGSGNSKPLTPQIVRVSAELIFGPERDTALDLLTRVEPASSLRSLDPGSIAADLLKAAYAIAIERASEAAKQYVRRYLVEQLCTNLTIGRVRRTLKNSSLSSVYSPDDQQNEPLLATTCILLESLRIDELASAKDALWRAVAADTARLGTRVVATAIQRAEFRRTGVQTYVHRFDPILKAASDLLLHSLVPTTGQTEREAQVLLLSLGQVGLTNKANDWGCAMEAGLGVLRVCLRDGTCPADELQALLISERAVSTSQDSPLREAVGKAKKALADWNQTDVRFKHPLELLKNENDPLQFVSSWETLSPSFPQAIKSDLETTLAQAKTKGGEPLQPCSISSSIEIWPELPALLGKMGDVLQPPPGTSQSTTTANTLEIVFQIASQILNQAASVDEALTTEQVSFDSVQKGASGATPADVPPVPRSLLVEDKGLSEAKILFIDHRNSPKLCGDDNTCAEKAAVYARYLDLNFAPDSDFLHYTRILLKTLLSVVTVIRGEDPSVAVAGLGAVLSTAVDAHCKWKGSTCRVPVKAQQIRTGFAVLSAVATYAASYRDGDGNNASDGDRKKGEDERKKALAQVINAFTDRTNRQGDWVFSLGANVNLGPRWSWSSDVEGEEPKDPTFSYNVLHVPIGLSLQQLSKPVGFHVMAYLLDPAQWLSVQKNDGNEDDQLEAADFNVATVLAFGGEIGIVWGDPAFPITTSGSATFVPQVEYNGNTRSEWRLGGSMGIYVPFFDFN